MHVTCKLLAFTWTDQRQKAFKTVNNALMKSLILVYPYQNKPFTLFIDASGDTWSTVLTPMFWRYTYTPLVQLLNPKLRYVVNDKGLSEIFMH